MPYHTSIESDQTGVEGLGFFWHSAAILATIFHRCPTLRRDLKLISPLLYETDSSLLGNLDKPFLMNFLIFNYEVLILSSVLFLANLRNALIPPHSLLPYISSFIKLDISSLLLLKVFQVEILHHQLHILTLAMNYLDTFFLDHHHQLNAFLPVAETMTPLRIWQCEYSPQLQLSSVINSLFVFLYIIFPFIILTAQSYLSKINIQFNPSHCTSGHTI